jgi:hypothetical protein
MAIKTQYDPKPELNATLLEAGVSKTVYALVTPQTERAKAYALGQPPVDDVLQLVLAENTPWAERQAKIIQKMAEAKAAYLEQFRDAWTGKQDAYHEDFFKLWHAWSSPVIDLNLERFPFHYPSNGASEVLRHLIFSYATRALLHESVVAPTIHVFEGEYEGYKAMAEDAGLLCKEWPRSDWETVAKLLPRDHMFFISQPSAIDGNVWEHFNAFLKIISEDDQKWNIQPRVVVDLTYVGAVERFAITEKFDMNQRCVRNVVFSLSKPFGAYYDRIGGVYCRTEDSGLFGNKWFKNLSSLAFGRELLKRYDVFYMPNLYSPVQKLAVINAKEKLGLDLRPSDVYLLANGDPKPGNKLADYITRAGRMRACLTPFMAEIIGTAGPVNKPERQKEPA